MSNGNGNDPLDPLDRLRAADPAARVEPRAGFVDEVIDRAVRGSVTDDPVHAQAVDLGAERTRRRFGWLPLVAVAASIAVIGGAGYGLGSLRPGVSTTTGGAPPPISLQVPGGRGEAGAGEPGAGQRSRSADSLVAGMPDRAYGFGFGQNSFSASGLSDSAGTAAGYALDARGASNEVTIGALAAALGVDGVPTLADGSWTVGTQDGTAASLWVGVDGMMSFSYSNPALDPWSCASKGDEPDVLEQCDPPSNLPGPDAAIAELGALLARVGWDPADVEMTSETGEGSYVRTAQAWPIIDGQRADLPWNLDLTADGVYSVYGTLAEIVPLGDYAIASEQEAFERLSDPRFGALMTAYPMDALSRPMLDDQEWVPPTEPPATPTAGSSVRWPVHVVTVISARLGLANQWQQDGSILIVPAYEFTDADGATWSVIAVDESMLDFGEY